MYQERIVGDRNYIKYSDKEAGDVLIDGLAYTGQSEGKFGPNYEFRDETGLIHVLGASGALKWKMQDAVIGRLYKITFLGKELIGKGVFKGKEFIPINAPNPTPSPQEESALPEPTAPDMPNTMEGLI